MPLSRQPTRAEGTNERLPFPVGLAETVPDTDGAAERLAVLDVTETVARVAGRARPTGRRDTILIVTITDRPDAQTDLLAAELASRGAPVCYFRTQDADQPAWLSISLDDSGAGSGLLRLPAGDFALDEVRSVWFAGPNRLGPHSIAPSGHAGYFAREREAALAGLYGALRQAFWVSHPNAIYAADDKVTQLEVAAGLGLRIPRTLITNDTVAARHFFDSCAGAAIVKTFRGVISWNATTQARVLTNRLTVQHFDQMRLEAPCLFQEYVPKDVELRVTVIGRRVLAVEIDSQRSQRGRDDWRRLAVEDLSFTPCTLPADIETACVRLLEHYGLAFGAIDMIRRPDGALVFLELNANGQFVGLKYAAGLPVLEVLADMLIRGSID
jgi:glutathione synthase/RimK-type ligase-like ATP-grasp enzyme